MEKMLLATLGLALFLAIVSVYSYEMGISPAEAASIIKDFFLAFAALVTAYVAYTGINKWQKELGGKATFETGRSLLKSTYKLREALNACRSPFYAAEEFPGSYQGALGKHTAAEETEAWQHVYSKRWEPLAAAIREFDACVLEAEALWGKHIQETAENIRLPIRKLYAAIKSDISNYQSGGQNFKGNREFAKAIKEQISNTDPENNPLTREVDKAIKEMEEAVKPHFSRK